MVSKMVTQRNSNLAKNETSASKGEKVGTAQVADKSPESGGEYRKLDEDLLIIDEGVSKYER